MKNNKESKRKIALNFLELFTKTNERYEEYIKLREQCNNAYEEFKNKPFNKLIKCSFYKNIK